MLNKRLTQVSRKLATGLRHRPLDIFNKELSTEGFMDVATIVSKLGITRDELALIIELNDKNRFELVGTNVRARQGHTISVDVGLEEKEPPSLLFHGTVESAERIILNEGINKMTRHHVHLSEDVDTASNVGYRRVKIHDPLSLLMVDSQQMFKDGYKFYQSTNGVWLTDFVPPDYIQILE